MDVGPTGEDQGKGGKYLLLPPGHKGEIPPGYIPVVMNTYNSYALFRAISETTSKEDVAKALALVKQIKAYPLANAANPPEQRYIDIHGTVFDAIVRFDASFYESLARMINEEPVQPHDLSVMNLLRSLGIEKGHDFKPDAATRKVLQAAAQESNQWFMNGLITSGDRFWPNRNWDDLIPKVPEERRPAIRYWQRRLESIIARSFPDGEERTEASKRDRQGLGVPRDRASET